MTRHDRARILESRIALDARFDQIADNAEHATDRAEHERLDDVHLDSRNEREQTPERHREDEASEEAFPGFLRRDLRRHLVLAELRADKISEGIVAPHAREDTEDEHASPVIGH